MNTIDKPTNKPSDKERATALCNRCKRPFVPVTFGTVEFRVFRSPTCRRCVRKAEREAEQERKRLAALEHEKGWALLCPLEFRLRSEMGGHTDISRMDAEQPEWRTVLRWTFGPRGLLIAGDTGLCKTRAVWRLLRRVWDDTKGRSKIEAITSGQFERQYRAACGGFNHEWFNGLARCSVLFVDDLGKAHWSENAEAQFFDLLDERTRFGRPIIVTTNDTGESWRDRLTPTRGPAIIRRLQDYCEFMELTAHAQSTEP